MHYKAKKVIYLVSMVLLGTVGAFFSGLPMAGVGESADPISYFELQTINLVGKSDFDLLPAQINWNDRQHRDSAILLARYIGQFNTGLRFKDRERIAGYIVRLAKRYKFNPYFIAAFVQVESTFYNYAISPAGAIGLMQLRPFVAQEMAEELGLGWQGEETLYDPFFNLEVGVHYLYKLRRSFHNQVLPMISAYNFGPNRIAERARAERTLPEGYYRKVAWIMQRIEGQVTRFPA